MPAPGFSKVNNSRKLLYGLRRCLVCGYAAAEQETLLAMMLRWGFADMPTLFAGAADMDRPVGELLREPAGYGQGVDSPLPRAVVLSGLTEKELSTFMAAWKHLGLPRQNWAVLTPTSEGWPLMELLAELDLERLALGK
ncbi:MAG: DUF3783 domain-containing protein [Proteobacteria bacterium]|nr:DUF3783 domain-containing protein [Pseudomonadota bacterium]MBU1594299.1 DUF3783 domain-containing protein [Pseudomonadota bacterium]